MIDREQPLDRYEKETIESWQPYRYQEDCLQTLQIMRRSGESRALVVMASGLGKTALAAFDVQNYLKQNHGAKSLFICHQRDILEQAHETFGEILESGYSLGYFHGDQKDFSSDILFATFQTMKLWREEFNNSRFDYIVVDESHHTPAETYVSTLEYFRPKFLLGITATPDRTDLLDIRKIYGGEIYSLPLEEALAQGLLAQVDYRLITDELLDFNTLKTPIGRLSIKQLNRRLFIPKRDQEIARLTYEKMEEVPNPRMMIFCSSIEHCMRLVQHYPNSAAIHSDLSDSQQREALQAFRNGTIHTIITVDKFNEGIDVPDANIIVFLRSTSSRTVFLQQLGRGLRKTEGKEKVLVLDFVGNCQRLEMVHDLWSSVEQKSKNMRSGSYRVAAPLTVDVGSLEFSEISMNVLDVIASIRVGYTKEVLVDQLHSLATQLGRVPTMYDVNKASTQGLCAGGSTFAIHFGSFSNALKQSGLPVARTVETKGKDNNEMIMELVLLANELNRTPTDDDINEASKIGKCVSLSTYRKRFGSWSGALREAGLELSTYHKSEEETLADLRKLAEELGRIPTFKEVNEAAKTGKYPSGATYYQKFGSFTEALVRAGLNPSIEAQTRAKSDENLLTDLRLLAQELGRTPTVTDIDKARVEGYNISSSGAYKDRFGSYYEAVKRAGLPGRKDRILGKTAEELISDLISLANEIGRTPTSQDIKEASKEGRSASLGVYIRHFGSHSQAIKQAGLPVHVQIRTLLRTDDELLNDLKSLTQKLGRIPMQFDVAIASKSRLSASPSTYQSRFGTFKNALKKAGLID